LVALFEPVCFNESLTRRSLAARPRELTMATPRKTKGSGRPEGTEYQLRIAAYTPATIPMARLAQYMADLAIMFCERDSVHFRGLTKGRTILNARVDREAAPRSVNELWPFALAMPALTRYARSSR
jgi:hypothetical protein